MSGHSPYPVLESDGIYYWYVDNNPLIINGEKVRATGPKGDMPDMSNYYDKETINEKLNDKQSTISDLDDIRSGANKGKTSVQKIKFNGKETSPTNGVVDLGTIGAINNYIAEFTARDITDIIGTENTILVSKELIDAVENGKTLVIRPDSISTAGVITNSYIVTFGTTKFLIIEFSTTFGIPYTYSIEVRIYDETYITARNIIQTALQPKLISGETIKTINGNSILGAGDLQLENANIIASQIFLEMSPIGDLGNGVYGLKDKTGYELHNLDVYKRMVPNIGGYRNANNEMFFATINTIIGGQPYMYSALLNCENNELVYGSFVSNAPFNDTFGGSIASIAVNTAVIAEAANNDWLGDVYWKLSTKTIPSKEYVDSLGGGSVYVTEFDFSALTSSAKIPITTSFVEALNNKSVILVPWGNFGYLVANVLRSNAIGENISIGLALYNMPYVYQIDISIKTPATVKGVLVAANVRSATLTTVGDFKTINGESILGRGDIVIESINKPDWNENDENSSSYIANRTHFAGLKGVFNIGQKYSLPAGTGAHSPESYRLRYKGELYKLPSVGETAYYPNEANADFSIFLSESTSGSNTAYTISSTVVNEAIANAEVDVVVDYMSKKIDDFYIPDTIARKGDLVTTLVYKAASKVENTAWTESTFGASIIRHEYNVETKVGVIYFSDRITKIGDEAFYDCRSLTSVTIPDSVTTIGWNAFFRCSSLTSVYCKATTPPTGGSKIFDGNALDRKIYVPMESVEAYKNAEYWDYYASSIVGYHYDVGLFKTINGESIVGEGDITIDGGGDMSDYATLEMLEPRNIGVVDTTTEVDDVVGLATTEYVDRTIANAITLTLNTPV